ncbi:NDP-hexose 2,3-dehydratase family protein [Actinoplanes flavus]|nr:NDP-hexose 2,3-dehydratase family protein [Actinoplanes flavus]
MDTRTRALALDDPMTNRRFAGSAAARPGGITTTEEFLAWFAERERAQEHAVTRIPFDRLSGWSFDPGSGNLAHSSGRFFTIEGLHVRTDREWRSSWDQPIMVQPEIGILGILVKEFDGVLHCLMQAKMEPGNINGIQLSPTVQATRSNYSRVHRGSGVKYLEYFTEPGRRRVLVDVLQSEQCDVVLHKRNRNMVVEVLDDGPPPDPDFCWVTLGLIQDLLSLPNVVNMDTRTVLSCLPVATDGDATAAPGRSRFAREVLHSLSSGAQPMWTTLEALRWLTDQRARRELVQERIPLARVCAGDWRRTSTEIHHRDGRYFKVIAVDVQSSARELRSWTQPLVAPVKPGFLGLLVARFDGVLHALMQARGAAGTLNGPELAPTVHCQPDNYAAVPERNRPRYFRELLSADPARVRYDVMLSEEGGRLYHAENRYRIVEAEPGYPRAVPPGYCWLTFHQLGQLLLHSNYLTVEARTLFVCAQAIR